MTRFFKILAIAGGSSAYLMQAPCTFAQHGFSIFPTIAQLTGTTVAGLLGLGT
jgi:hypothetical protein